MTAIKSLWASVQGDPKLMRRVNGWLTLFWVAMIPVSMIMGWLSSVVYVSALSLWALVSGHWSAWQAARVEVNQQRAEEEAAQVDLPTEVADQVIARTGLAPAPPIREQRDEPAGWPQTAPAATPAIGVARDLVMVRCQLDPEQALTYLKNYATLSGQTLDGAARHLVSSAATPPPSPAHFTRVIGVPAGPRETQPMQMTTHHPQRLT